jgi:hypothetical protein
MVDLVQRRQQWLSFTWLATPKLLNNCDVRLDGKVIAT